MLCILLQLQCVATEVVAAICCHMPRTVLICCCMLYSCYLLPLAIQWHMPYSWLLVVQFATCYLMLYSLLCVAACHAISYLLPHVVQFVSCCCMLCSLLSVAAHCMVCLLLPLLLASIIWGKLDTVKTA